jgi:BirA family biotin operon repressor/biotin-[acetyl-CoA-carboxylase] ligase
MGIAGTRFSGRVVHLASVGSTNALALEAAQGGAADGCVFVADEQTAGRGRSGHAWHSAVGDGLYVTALVRPRMALAEALWLSLSTGLAVQAAIASVTGLKADLRWPNDLLLGGRKCVGILVETAATAGTPAMLRYAAIGVGLNVNHASFPTELAELATSLRQESGSVWDRERVLAEFLCALEREIGLLEAELRHEAAGAGLLERFAAASTWVRGKRVRVEEEGGYTGVTDGLDARGFLRVSGDDGVLHTVLSGGVREQDGRASGRADAAGN